jgi:hypothetical protein
MQNVFLVWAEQNNRNLKQAFGQPSGNGLGAPVDL